MRPTWVDGEVAVAWCRFVNLMEDRHAPADVMALLTEVDHALLSEAVQQCASNADAARQRLVKRVRH